MIPWLTLCSIVMLPEMGYSYMEKQANDLSKYRYEKAVQCVNSARYVMGIKDYNFVSNKSNK